MQQGLFIRSTVKKRTINDASLSPSTKEDNKRRKHTEEGEEASSKSQTRILADTQASSFCSRGSSYPSPRRRCDIDLGYVNQSEEFESRRYNAMVSALMAMNLYMVPKNVMLIVLYWLRQYINYKKPENEWFNDHIKKLIQYPLQFNITSSQGIPHIHAKMPKHTLLLHFAASELHKIPSEWFDVQGNTDLLECLIHYVTNASQYFLTRNHFGLEGEVTLASFEYNKILSYFYEPSFFIITSYLVYIHCLFHMSYGESLNDFLPTLRHIQKPILLENLNFERDVRSLNCENTNYESKRADFEQDLASLVQILNLNDMKEIKESLAALWSRKASFMHQEMYSRHNTIYSQLYPDDASPSSA